VASLTKSAIALALACLTLLPFVPMGEAPMAPGSTSIVLPARLPMAADMRAAVWVGDAAYVFGGWQNDQIPLDTIVRFQPGPTGGTVTGVPARLPVATAYAAAVWTGTYVYLFGGIGGTGTEIIRFDPATNAVGLLSSRLPSPIALASAVWTGSEAYILGGASGATAAGPASMQIVRFDPVTEVATVVPTALLVPFAYGAAFWDGSAAYTLGGALAPNGGAGHAAIQRFDPVQQAVTFAGDLPSGNVAHSAVWDGSLAYVLGGYGADSAGIVSFDPASGLTVLTGMRLPMAMWDTAAVTNGCEIFVFNGSGAVVGGTEIVRVGLCPVPPPPPPPPPVPPVLAMAVETRTTTCLAAVLRFQDASVPAGAFDSWAWDFGDGNQGWGSPVDHEYRSPGIFVVTVTASASDGLHSVTREVSVALGDPCPPSIDPFVPVYLREGDVVRFCGVGHAGMAGNLSYSITGLPPGAVVEEGGRCFSWTANTPGFMPCIRFEVAEDVPGIRTQFASTCLALRVFPFAENAPDSDQDGVADMVDNCPAVANHGQDDRSGDGVGDACQILPSALPSSGMTTDLPQDSNDSDQDGVADAPDNCPAVPNHKQGDLDGDALGDLCDIDVDGDGIMDAHDDCPETFDPRQSCSRLAPAPVTAARPTAPAVRDTANSSDGPAFVWTGLGFALVLGLAVIGYGLLRRS